MPKYFLPIEPGDFPKSFTDDNATIRMVDTILQYALKDHATGIHLVPTKILGDPPEAELVVKHLIPNEFCQQITQEKDQHGRNIVDAMRLPDYAYEPIFDRLIEISELNSGDNKERGIIELEFDDKFYRLEVVIYCSDKYEFERIALTPLTEISRRLSSIYGLILKMEKEIEAKGNITTEEVSKYLDVLLSQVALVDADLVPHAFPDIDLSAPEGETLKFLQIEITPLEG